MVELKDDLMAASMVVLMADQMAEMMAAMMV
jgi:hypothetical protein